MNQPLPDTRRVQRDVTWRSLLKACVVAAGVWLLLHLRPILVVIVVASVLVGTVSPIVAALERRMRRGWALAIVFTTCSVVVHRAVGAAPGQRGACCTRGFRGRSTCGWRGSWGSWRASSAGTAAGCEGRGLPHQPS